MLADKNRHLWVRGSRTEANHSAAGRYCEGIQRRLGIALQAICATDEETSASVFVPADDCDRQNHLMGCGRKLSCPTEIR